MASFFRVIIVTFFALVFTLRFPIIPCFAGSLENSNSDKILLDTLQKKGILTDEEVSKISKKMSEQSENLVFAEEKMRIYFYAQFRCYVATQNYEDENIKGYASTQGAALRRQIWAFFADFNDSTDAFISINTAAGHWFDSAALTKKFDSEYFDGSLSFGHLRPNFNMEGLSGARIKTPDRSVIHTFWGGKDPGTSNNRLNRTANQCFSGNHIGIFANSKIPFCEDFVWSAAITNAKNDYWDNVYGKIGLAYWFSLGYEIKNDSISLRTGINFGYSTNIASAYDEKSNSSNDCEALGTALYFIMQRDSLFVQTEIVTSITEHGKTQSDYLPLYTAKSGQSNPFGAMAMIGYTFDIGEYGAIEPIIRYSFLNTNGAGVAEGNVLFAVGSPNGYYNEINAYYIGVNWYLLGESVKIQAGFEHLRFSDSPTSGRSKHCDTNLGILQIQLEF